MFENAQCKYLSCGLSVLFYEPKFPKYTSSLFIPVLTILSVLFYEPKFPKYSNSFARLTGIISFSALLRAEIPKIVD